MLNIREDAAFALRLLRKSPGFAATAVLTVAIGIGANAAIFSLIRGVLLKPLGYPQPEQLVFISSQFPTMGFDKFWISPPEFVELRERASAFSAVGGYRTGATNLGSSTEPQRVNAAIVTADLFVTLGVPAWRGRTFSDDETRPNAPPTVVLSYETWQQSLGGDADIVGKAIDVDGLQREVVGVMPPGFDVHDSHIAVYLPAAIDPHDHLTRRGNHFLNVVGRLAPGRTLEQARAELSTLLEQWSASLGQYRPPNAPVDPNTGGLHAPSSTGHPLRYDPLHAEVVGDVGRALWVLQAAVLVVLLIACANLANLLLARSETRHREFALRAALGAGRGRLLGQLVAEGLTLALIGGIAGLAVAWAALRAVVTSGIEGIPRLADVSLDLTVLGFAFALIVGTGVVFGLAPALHLGDRSLGSVMKSAGQRSVAGGAKGLLRRGLVVAELAMAVVLVAGALLLMRSFSNLTQVDAGFPRERLVTFGLVLPQAGYQRPEMRPAFFDRLLERLSRTPGVESVAAASGLPPLRDVNANDTMFEGVEQKPGAPPQNVDYYQTVTPGYLETLGIRVVSGRGFTASDAGSETPVVLVNETLVKRFYGDENPVGRRLRPGSAANMPLFTIVGVVADVKQGGVAAATGTELYLCYGQLPRIAQVAPLNMNVVVRSALAPSALAATVRREVAALDATLPIVDLRTMEDVFADTLSRPRLLAQLLGAFAGIAVLLAAIGTFGVLSYVVAERRREIGVRMALGAMRGSVLAMMMRQGLTLAVTGLVIGVVAALASTRAMRSLLFGVEPGDPMTLVLVCGGTAAVSALACYLPARRAASVDPVEVLRAD